MFDTIENLKLLSIRTGPAVSYGVYPDRPTHCFLFKCSGKSTYDIDGHTYLLEEGNMIFMPQGCTYTVHLVSEGESEYIAVNFSAELPPTPPQILSLTRSGDAQAFFRTLLRLWIFGDSSRRHQCYAMFYSMLADFTARPQDYQAAHQKALIQDGVAYLEQHIFDPELRIDDMIACSGVSEAYFRRIFQAVYGQSPKQYIQSKRLLQAHAILESGEFSTVQSVAAKVGYDDPLYFSRVFKRTYGIAPTELRTVLVTE